MRKALCFFLLPVICIALALSACANPGGGAPSVAGDASRFLTGNGIPSNATGADGDLYLDTQNLILYVKTSGAWANVGTLRGPSGSGWLIGSGVPSSSLGVSGDLYLDIAGMNGYQKQSGSWTVLFSFASGSSWFVGQGLGNAPSNPKVGDLFLDLLSTMIYKWSGSSWTQLVAFQVGIPQYVFTPNFMDFMKGIAFGQGVFVAVGEQGTIIYSPDGTNWEYGTYSMPSYSIVRNNNTGAKTPSSGKLISAKEAALHQKAILRRNAFNHSRTPVSKGIYDGGGYYGENFDLVGVAYGDGIFVAIGDGVMLTSTDGINWSYEDVTSTLGSTQYSVAYANGQFVVGGYGSIFEGTPESGWEPDSSLPTSFNIYGVVGDGGDTIVVGGEGAIQSRDASGWSENSKPTGPYVSGWTSGGSINGVAYGAGKFIAVGYRYGDQAASILMSGMPVSDASWTSQDIPSVYNSMLLGVVYGPSGFVAVGNYGTVLTSASGLSWANQGWGNGYNPSFSAVTWGWMNGQVLYAVAQLEVPQ